MITRIGNTTYFSVFTLVVILVLGSSCTKDTSQSTSTSQTSSSTIAVAASENSSASGDSVYIMQPCPRGYSRDSISAASLPSSAAAYLSASYPGYTFSKAFAIVNNSGLTVDYVAVIYFNEKPVAILFDSAGNFLKVLEQRDKGDIEGKGWHDGGRFCDRDGRERDTIALTSLPASILNYMSSNYSTDTLVKAFENRDDSGVVLISKNNGLFATVFDVNGNFEKRVALLVPPGRFIGIAESDLPTNALTYLTTSYPDFVFEKAFAVFNSNITLVGYVVVINSNNTKYALRFDSSGDFVAVKTIW